MSALLYYSISSDLSKDEIIKIDRQIEKNRETVFFFVRNLASNAKIGCLPMAPAPVVRVQPPSYQYDSNVQSGKRILLFINRRKK